jgi:hypothetical protein
MAFGTLWIPVLVSAVAVFVASSVVHMVLKYHKADYRPLSNESEVADAIRKGNPGPGLYVLPHCADMSQMKDPAVIAKYEKGPVGLVALLPNGAPNMGKLLGQWFGFCLLLSFAIGYVARHTLEKGADGLSVMRVTGAIAFIGYGMSSIIDSIWHGVPWSNTVRALIDAAIYAVVTGLAFRLLWPS